MKQRNRKASIAGSLIALAAIALMTPLNMGGCASADLGNAVGSVVGTATHDSSLGDRTGKQVSAVGKTAQAMAIDERAEDGMGQSVALAVTNRYPLSDDAKLSRYVALVGQTVAYASSAPDGHWVFGVLDTDQVNAFSGPNGYIMITRGAIARMHDESELAGVLAHEVAHVTNKHGLEAVKNAGKLSGLKELAAASDDRIAQLAPATDFLVDTVITNGYSQGQENKADEDAVRILVSAGYDANGYARFLGRLHGGGGVMSTHPGAADRATRVSSQIRREVPATKGATMQARFAATVKAK